MTKSSWLKETQEYMKELNLTNEDLINKKIPTQ